MPRLEAIRIHGKQIKVGHQIQVLRSLPPHSFTIRDVDHALGVVLDARLDAHRASVAERVIQSWLAIGEIRAISTTGVTRYVQQMRKAA